MDTVKESVGSGWAMTSEQIFGNLDEAKALWTSLKDVISGAVGASAKARNDMLGGWKNMGGRDVMIQAFKDIFGAIGDVIAPIKDAFRDIFPKKTAGDLVILTGKFAEFASKLTISGETADKIKSVFSGLFSIFKIGFEIVKGVFGVFGAVAGALAGAGGGALSFAANLGDMIVKLRESLVEGGGIAKFFSNIGEYAAKAVGYITNFVSAIAGFFASLGGSGAEVASDGIKKVGERLSFLQTVAQGAGRVWDFLVSAFGKVKEALAPIGEMFSNIGSAIVNAFKPGNMSGALDALNVGLLGGIALLIKRFLDGGLKIDLGDGLFEKIGNTFDQLTSTLEAMQMKLKAEALMKIAMAIGVLTASVLVLSLIDSGALTKAMTALAVGFGQLIGAMALIDKFSDTSSGAKLVAVAGGMILLAGAVLILSFAIRSLSGLSWTELGKGLAGVAASMLLFAGVAKLLDGNTKGLIRAGVAMGIMAFGLLVMSLAVKAFADMEWDEMIKGFSGVAVGLGLLAGAMNLMPKSGMIQAGIAMVVISAGLLVLQKAVTAFSGMEWNEMIKGFAGVGAGLLMIAGAMWLMPPGMITSAAGILILSLALNVMAKAVETLGGLSLETLAKGLGSIAAMMLILVVATNAMTGALPGAIAMVVVAGALFVLAGVIKALSQLSIGELGIALLAIAGVFVVLGLAALLLTPVIPALMGLGIALALIGGAFALFGLGASLVAKAFETMARAGKAGVDVLIDVIEALIAALPGFVQTLARALIEAAMTFLDAAPAFIDAIGEIIEKILDKIIELAPKFAEAFSEILTGVIGLIREHVPQFITVAIELITALATGIRDNIYQLTTLAIEILLGLVQALTDNMYLIVNGAANLITSFLGALALHSEQLVTAGVNLIISLLQGITQHIPAIVTAVADLIVAFLNALATELPRIITAGTDLLIAFITGIADNLLRVVGAAVEIVTTFITEIGNGANRIVEAGADALVKFIEGLSRDIGNILFIGADAVAKFVEGVGNALSTITDAGAEALVEFISGISKDIDNVIKEGVKAIEKFIDGIVEGSLKLANAAADALVEFLDGLTDAIETHDEEIRRAGRDLAFAIADGFSGGLLSKAGEMARSVKDVLDGALNAGKSFLGIASPSKRFFEIGEWSAEGFAIAFNNNKSIERSVVDKLDVVVSAFKDGLSRIPDSLEGLDDLNPVITPVLDLTRVEGEAKKLAGLMGISSISPDVSYNKAQLISHTNQGQNGSDVTPVDLAPKEIIFNQFINSPTELSTNDIYRNTKSQIALAKEELSIK